MSRLLIVANRLPVTVRATEGGVEVQRSAGGLATGLMRPHEQSDGLWIGWAGAAATSTPRSRRRSTASSPRCGWSASRSRPISWPASTRATPTASSGRCSTTCSTRSRSRSRDWDGYVEANEAFADVVAAHYQPGDMIWVHDYQLLLLPGAPARTPAGRAHRLLPPHPVPVRGAVPDAAHRATACSRACSAPTSSASTRRPTCATSPRRSPTSSAIRSRSTGCSSPAGRCGSACSRWAWTRRRSRRSRLIPRSRARSRRSAATGACGSCWASIGSTTPRASPAGCLAYERMLDTHPELREKVRLVQVAVPVAHQRRRLSGLPRPGGRAGRPDQRRVRHRPVGAGALHLPQPVRARARRALPRRRRDAGDPAARRDEPRGQGVRRLADRRRRRAGAERVRRGGLGAARGAPGESVRRGGRRRRSTIGRWRCRARSAAPG